MRLYMENFTALVGIIFTTGPWGKASFTSMMNRNWVPIWVVLSTRNRMCATVQLTPWYGRSTKNRLYELSSTDVYCVCGMCYMCYFVLWHSHFLTLAERIEGKIYGSLLIRLYHTDRIFIRFYLRLEWACLGGQYWFTYINIKAPKSRRPICAAHNKLFIIEYLWATRMHGRFV